MVSNLGNRGEKGGARVEAVVSNHMEASFRETALVLQHAVQVLQMKRKKKGEGQPISIKALVNRRSGVQQGRCVVF